MYHFSPSEGIPQTGYKNASFALVLSNDVNASKYIWKANHSWVSVNSDGVVTLTDDADSRIIEVTGTRKNGHDTIGAITYVFQIKHWFWLAVGDRTWSSADNLCKQNGYSMPQMSQLYVTPYRRAAGTLKGEWGADLEGVSVSGALWTTDPGWLNTTQRNLIYSWKNKIFSSDPSNLYKAVCYRRT